MNVIPVILTVKGDEKLERAIAAELADDEDITESWLEQISVQYPAEKEEEKNDKIIST